MKTRSFSEAVRHTPILHCEQILAFFGEGKKLTNILPTHVARFYKSDELLKVAKNGKTRAPGTINKTKMVFKQLLGWAQEQGLIDHLPLPKPVPDA